jgi:hypothetical protein
MPHCTPLRNTRPRAIKATQNAPTLPAGMGHYEDWLADQELGFSASPAFVCDRHVDDDVLEAIIHEEASAMNCDFCERREDEPFAADTHAVLTQIGHAVNQKWTNPDNVLFYDSESESGYAGPVSDFEDVLRTEGEWPASHRRGRRPLSHGLGGSGAGSPRGSFQRAGHPRLTDAVQVAHAPVELVERLLSPVDTSRSLARGRCGHARRHSSPLHSIPLVASIP